MLRASWLDEELREILLSALPVAGRSGTLDDADARNRGRRAGPSEDGHAERGVGPLRATCRRRYAFSIIQNGSPVSTLLGAHGARTDSRRS